MNNREGCFHVGFVVTHFRREPQSPDGVEHSSSDSDPRPSCQQVRAWWLEKRIGYTEQKLDGVRFEDRTWRGQGQDPAKHSRSGFYGDPDLDQ